MSRFIEIVPQKSHVNVYYPGSHKCTGITTCDKNEPVIPCKGCDWAFSTVTCNPGCPDQLACSSLDSRVCPTLGTFLEAEWATSKMGVCLNDSESLPLVSCTYDASTLSYEDIQKYQNHFDKESNYNNIIMPEFCFRKTSDGMPIILSGDTDSKDECINWANKNPDIYDLKVKQYCSHTDSEGSEECKCSNRAISPVYQYISRNLKSEVKSNQWFNSCMNPQSHLVPMFLNNKSVSITGVCDEINNIISTVPTNLTKRQLQEEISCVISSTPSSNNSEVNSSSSSVSSASSNDTTSSSTFWIIITIIVVIIIIILLLLVFFWGSPTPTGEITHTTKVTDTIY